MTEIRNAEHTWPWKHRPLEHRTIDLGKTGPCVKILCCTI